MNYSYQATPEMGAYGALFIVAMILLVVWSLVWKGLAWWHSARRGDKVWFIVFLFLNTAGILEIIYLFAVAKITKKAEPTTPSSSEG